MFRKLLAVTVTTTVIACSQLVEQNDNAAAAERDQRIDSIPNIERRNLPTIRRDRQQTDTRKRAAPEASDPQIQIPPDFPDAIGMGECAPGFEAKQDPYNGHNYVCKSWQAAGIFGCNEPFETVPNSQAVMQGKATYECSTTAATTAPAASVCRLPFNAQKLNPSGSKTAYRCISWQPTCSGTWKYKWGTLGYYSNFERFQYVCQY